jgi:hypothetical protein
VVEKEKLSGKRRFKIFFFPASSCARNKENNAVQNGTISVFFFKKRKENVIWKNPKMGYDSCPLYNAYKAKKLLDALHSKLVKKKQEWSIFSGDLPIHTHSGLFSGATSPHTHTGLFSRATCPHTLTLIYFHGQAVHTHLPWSIFMGDLPK